MILRIASVLMMAFLSVAAVTAGDAPAPAMVPAPVVVPATPVEADSLLSDDEKWVFEPSSGRIDPFYNLTLRMKLELEIKPIGDDADVGSLPKFGDNSNWAKAQIQRVQQLILAKKWDDAIKACEVAIKQLSKDQDNEEAQQLIENFKRYRTQAEEAKTYEEAQAKFDALELKIEGILWSPDGSLAVINGEPRARAVNERVKDCVIINIDTNRVDFLFHHNRRRFEFQRYVGEDAKSSAKAAK
ncbi:MAG: hypothetical protein H0X45_02725 [Planctomycetes bacterium]|nr:hypothetical protein [Planctomycetota bacterium]